MTDGEFRDYGKELVAVPAQSADQWDGFYSDDMQIAMSEARGFWSYSWYREVHRLRAARHMQASLVAQQEDLPTKFFVDTVHDIYSLDRALRVADALGAEPVRRASIPDQISRTVVGNGRIHVRASEVENLPCDISVPVAMEQSIPHNLSPMQLCWNENIPNEVLDAVSLVLETQPPDELWRADYKHGLSRYDSWRQVIFARFGNWHVEVGRWE
jgi:hypothetical protein